MTTVLLIDRSQVVLNSARALLSHYPDIKVVGAVTTLSDAIPLIEEFIPDVTVLDLSMTDEGDLSAQQGQTLAENSRSVVCMPLREEKDISKLASLIGVAVCIDKLDLYHELPKAIREVGMSVAAPN